MKLQYKFVDYIPEKLDEGIIYISIEFSTAVHKCVCGCRNEVVTPFSPPDWSLLYNGSTVSLSPSIGNWSFPCKSHYWIKKGKVSWAGGWSNDVIESGRAQDKIIKEEFYNENKEVNKSDTKFSKRNNNKWSWLKFWNFLNNGRV